MKEHEINQEIERVKQARRLGGFDKSCEICGEPNPRCLDRHEPGGRGYNPESRILCANCHRKQHDPKQNQRAPEYPALLDRIGHWLQGIALFLLELGKKAYEY